MMPKAVRVRSHNRKGSEGKIESQGILPCFLGEMTTHIGERREIHTASQKLREEYISVRMEL